MLPILARSWHIGFGGDGDSVVGGAGGGGGGSSLCIHMCLYACIYVWSPEGIVRYCPQSLLLPCCMLLLLNLELGDSARLAGQQAMATLLASAP